MLAPKRAVLSDLPSSTNDESKARYLRAMPNARQTGIFPAECNAGWELFLVPACNAEHPANRKFPCGVQCRVGAVFGTCMQCRMPGKQEFSLRSAMQGGSCFWYLCAMPNVRQTGIFPAECNAGWKLWTAVIEGTCLLLALLLFPQVQVERPLRFQPGDVSRLSSLALLLLLASRGLERFTKLVVGWLTLLFP